MNGTSEQAIFQSVDAGFAGPWLVADRGCVSFVGRLFATARRRCLVSLFLVSAPSRDQEHILRGLLFELAKPSRRGVDVRLLVGAAESNGAATQVAEMIRRRADVLGIPSRWISNIPIVAGHSRIVVSDDNVLVGSHDGSAPSGPGQPDNVFLASGSLARALDRRFQRQWTQAAAPPVASGQLEYCCMLP